MKRLINGINLKGILAFWFYSVFLTVLPIESAERQIRVNLGTIAPRGSSHYQTLMAMREKWRNAPGGGVNLVIYPDGIQGGESDMVRLMRIGSLQSALLSIQGLTDIESGVNVFNSIPMVFRNFDELEFVNDKLRPKLEERILKKGFVVLFWGDTGWIRYFSKQPLIQPEELKKMKIFVWSGSPVQVEIMHQAGYYPVPLETSEILPGFQTGLINVIAVPPLFALAGQLDKLAPHMLNLNWAPLVGALVIRSSTWNKIPDETKNVLLITAAIAGEEMKANGRKESYESVDAMVKRGLTVHNITPEIEEEWRETVVQTIYPRIRGHLVDADLFDKVIQLLQEYRTLIKEEKSE